MLFFIFMTSQISCLLDPRCLDIFQTAPSFQREKAAEYRTLLYFATVVCSLVLCTSRRHKQDDLILMQEKAAERKSTHLGPNPLLTMNTSLFLVVLNHNYIKRKKINKALVMQQAVHFDLSVTLSVRLFLSLCQDFGTTRPWAGQHVRQEYILGRAFWDCFFIYIMKNKFKH